MKKFILSDLHIGHKDAQYDAMDQAIAYIQKEFRQGDEIWGLGDWFHMYENGFEHCLQHPMTQKFRDLAGRIPTNLLPGNHDHVLEKYRDNPNLANPIGPIKLIKPFMQDEIWYCHGHEYDPSVQYIPHSLMWLWNHLPQRKLTPSNLKMSFITERDAGLSGAIQGFNQPSTKGEEGTPGMQRNCFWTYPFAPLPAVSGFNVCT